ncbi:MAG TPA: hypothetical protein ENI29_06040 [bacterium]|nr:hypothetical protein [bacterium]
MSPNFNYKYKTISVKHLDELQEDVNKLIREGKLSDNEIYRSYLSEKKFGIPETIPNAKSLIVMAIFTKLAYITFNSEGKKHKFMIPPQYYDDGLTYKDLDNTIFNEIIKEPGYKIELVKRIHLKLLAVRSGLTKYGRNNISYVDEMGSFISLYTYFTDYNFEEDSWTEIKMMDTCTKCKICSVNCPTNSINAKNSNFVINAGRCITLYNEIEGEFPNWINPNAHNALMGCMKCQFQCPANRKPVKQPLKFEDISEEETKMILSNKPDENLLNSMCNKLKMFSPSDSEKMLPILKRNLEVLLK